MNTRTRTFIYIALIFASGLLIGATLMNVAEHHWLHAESRTEIDISHHRQIARRMKARLNLSLAQQRQVDRILRQTVASYLRVENEMKPQFELIRSQGRERMRSIMNPQQRARFDQIVKQVDAKYPNIMRSPFVPLDGSSQANCAQTGVHP